MSRYQQSSPQNMSRRRNGLMPSLVYRIAEKLGNLPGLVDVTMDFLGVINDAIRLGEYTELGPPQMNLFHEDIPPNSVLTRAINVLSDGQVTSFNGLVQNVTAAPADPRPLAGVTQVAIASQKFYDVTGPGAPSAIVGPVLPAVGMTPNVWPFDTQGFLRRIRVKEGDTWQVTVENQSLVDTYQLTFTWSQYANYAGSQGE